MCAFFHINNYVLDYGYPCAPKIELIFVSINFPFFQIKSFLLVYEAVKTVIVQPEL